LVVAGYLGSLGVVKTAKILAGAILFACGVASAANAGERADVWGWFASCKTPEMSLEVRLDRKVIYKSTVPICQAERSTFHRDSDHQLLRFSFTPRRAIVWKGYRDNDSNTTAPNQPIEGNVWLAGSDPDALLLGVSFSMRRTGYMNTIHIAHPFQRDQTEIASGLFVITKPVSLGVGGRR
jgi:hypothetical protein